MSLNENSIQDFDSNLYIAKFTAAATVFPDLNDAELQDSYHVMSAEQLLNRLLLAGERIEYIRAVQEFNSVQSFGEGVEEVKN